ncbi:MAG: hypothetical protein H0U75_04955 [Legionella sp.]|nr:hypothetical protein [Legionella sp.]
MKVENKNKNKYWQDHIEKWSGSGLSQSAYCKENNLAYSTFSDYRRKFYDKNQELPEAINFISIPCPPKLNTTSAPALQLMLPNGIRIGISSQPATN